MTGFRAKVEHNMIVLLRFASQNTASQPFNSRLVLFKNLEQSFIPITEILCIIPQWVRVNSPQLRVLKPGRKGNRVSLHPKEKLGLIKFLLTQKFLWSTKKVNSCLFISQQLPSQSIVAFQATLLNSVSCFTKPSQLTLFFFFLLVRHKYNFQNTFD